MNGLQVVRKEVILGMELNAYGDVENPLFLARDIANVIEHNKAGEMIQNLEDGVEKLMSTVSLSGQKRECWFLTEDGVYEVLMTSRKPVAKEFRKGFKEFLKAWRKGEVKVVDNRDPMEIIQEALVLANRLVEEERAEKVRLAIQLDIDSKYHSIKRVAKRHDLNWRDLDWRALKKASLECGVEIRKIFDANYGEVNSYHIDAWEIAYPEIEL